jgi:hypothetical protein
VLRRAPPDEWKPIAPSKAQAVQKFTGLIPRNQPDRAIIDLLEAAMNLLPPCVFGLIVNLDIEALDQRVDQRGASLGRKR